MTETDRKHISGESNPSQDQKDQAVYRVRQRINEELPQDIGVLDKNRPDVLDELRHAVYKTPRIADGIKAYEGVKDHPETGEDEILFDGVPIQGLAYDGSGEEGITWGYGGRGPTSAARSILVHAINELDLQDVEIGHNDQIEFRREFLQKQEGSHWGIPLSTVENWIRKNL